MLPDDSVRRLAETFAAVDYRVDAVVDLIGEPAQRALGRNATLPARRALAGRDDALATLTLLWPLQQPVPLQRVQAALPGLVEPLLTAGLLRAEGDAVRAEVDIRPYASDDGATGWIVSDLTPNLDTAVAPVRPDFVLGVSAASSTLAQLTLRRPVDRALDLGTGCGVQSLHLARHARQVVATDLNPRAVELARLTSRLNGVDVDVRIGDLYAPVAGERFDLITSNPPYVMSPPSAESARLTYREGNAPADGLVQQVVSEGAAMLAEDGVLQVLANWAHVRGQDWRDRVTGWLPGSGFDAHIVQREVLDPFEYAELWLTDAGLAGRPDYLARYAEWLDYFDRLQIEAVGLGWLVVHRSGSAQPRRHVEEWPHPIEQPIAPALGAELAAVARDRALTDEEVLGTTWRLAADVVQETVGVPGLADPQHVVLRQQRGFRRAVAVDTATAAILGACDGELRLDQVVAAVAQLLGEDAGTLAVSTTTLVRELARDGLLA